MPITGTPGSLEGAEARIAEAGRTTASFGRARWRARRPPHGRDRVAHPRGDVARPEGARHGAQSHALDAKRFAVFSTRSVIDAVVLGLISRISVMSLHDLFQPRHVVVRADRQRADARHVGDRQAAFLGQALICVCAALRSFFEVPLRDRHARVAQAAQHIARQHEGIPAQETQKVLAAEAAQPRSALDQHVEQADLVVGRPVGEKLAELPCSAAISLTNFAFSRTDLIFFGLRTMRLSEASFSQNSAGWNNSRLGLISRNASSKPGHF